MHKNYCGIDFGTSNSSISVADENLSPRLIAVENGSFTIPSAIFFEQGKTTPIFGRAAAKSYMDGVEGRFMRSLKRVLGTDLMTVGTVVNGRSQTFSSILSQFIKHLKNKAELNQQFPIESVVMGRPVFFRDNDERGNILAGIELENIAKNAGFKNIAFQYEPLAAAYAHEVNIKDERLAIVIDIGGGTSDFSVIRVGKKLQSKMDRSDDILANTGIRIGGNDFDKSFCLSCFMPEFGFRTTYGKKNLPVPSSQYFDLSEWSKVNSVYNYTNKRIIKQVLAEAHQPNLYSRLQTLVEKEQGHMLLSKVENSKIALTSSSYHQEPIDFLENQIKIPVTTSSFNSSIENNCMLIRDNMFEALRMAQIKNTYIKLIVLTGGSTEIPYLNDLLCSVFPHALISENDKLSSVALGLGLDSLRKFQ